MMNFRVRAGNKDLSVEFVLATQGDLNRLSHWRTTKHQRHNQHVTDALEFCRLAGKRWRTYRAANRIVTNQNELKEAHKSRNEAVFVMIARADWHKPSPILGFCFCRKTWCHHIILDFVAVHPNAIRAAGGPVLGVGSGMLYSVIQLADTVGVKTVWGEATENSAPFYAKALALQNITDHFFITGETFLHCLRQFEFLAGDHRP